MPKRVSSLFFETMTRVVVSNPPVSAFTLSFVEPFCLPHFCHPIFCFVFICPLS